MIDFEKVLSIIGSICSIVGIPLTICQVLKIKSNSEASKDAIDNFIILRKNETLREIQNYLSEQINILDDIKKCIKDRKGYEKDYISNQCDKIIKNINMCILNIPVEYNEIVEKLQNVITFIEELEDSEQLNTVSEIRNSLFRIITSIKEEKENCIKLQKNNASK